MPNLNRRQFVKTSVAALGAAAIPFPLSCWGSLRDFTPLRRNVGTFEGQGGTIGWLIADDALVVIDTQFPESATTCWDGVQERSSRGIDYLINTHHHGDHTAGNPVFAPHSDHHVAHRNVPGLQKAAAERSGNEADQVYAGELFEKALKLDAGDETLHLTYFGNAHTSGDAAILFEKAGVVHMGDLVFNRRTMFLDLGAGGTSAGWIDVLEKAYDAYTDDLIFIYGHGNPSYGITGTRDDLMAMRDFLTGLREHVSSALAAGKSYEEMLVNQLPMFEVYNPADDPSGLHRNIRNVYDEMTADAD